MKRELNIVSRCRVMVEQIKPVVLDKSKWLLKSPFFFLVVSPLLFHIPGLLPRRDCTSICFSEKPQKIGSVA